MIPAPRRHPSRPFRRRPMRTNLDRLRARGLEFPEPEVLDEAALSAKLWELIEALSALRVVLWHTDHLSERELYSVLVREILVENSIFCTTKRWALPEDAVEVIDVLHDGTEDSIRTFLRYYADDRSWQNWAEDWPELLPGERLPLPYDRDRFLPSPEELGPARPPGSEGSHFGNDREEGAARPSRRAES